MKNTIMVGIMAVMLMVMAVSGMASNIPVPDPQFTCANSGSIIGVYGYVVDESGKGIEGAPIEVECRREIANDEFQSFMIDTNDMVSNGAYEGFYYVRHANNETGSQCWVGDEVQVTVLMGDQQFQSEWVPVQCQSYYYNTGNFGSVSVPEFSTVTLGVAIAGAMLGLVFLRKNN